MLCKIFCLLTVSHFKILAVKPSCLLSAWKSAAVLFSQVQEVQFWSPLPPVLSSVHPLSGATSFTTALLPLGNCAFYYGTWQTPQDPAGLVGPSNFSSVFTKRITLSFSCGRNAAVHTYQRQGCQQKSWHCFLNTRSLPSQSWHFWNII